MVLRPALLLMACLAAYPVAAAESDVHFGLTKFLAVQAGFDAGQDRKSVV